MHALMTSLIRPTYNSQDSVFWQFEYPWADSKKKYPWATYATLLPNPHPFHNPKISDATSIEYSFKKKTSIEYSLVLE